MHLMWMEREDYNRDKIRWGGLWITHEYKYMFFLITFNTTLGGTSIIKDQSGYCILVYEVPGYEVNLLQLHFFLFQSTDHDSRRSSGALEAPNRDKKEGE